MSLSNVSAGENLPSEFNVIVEIPMHGDPVKYEVDKDSGAVFVDRFMSTPMHMEDENGQDDKLLAVPISKLLPLYDTVTEPSDLPGSLLQQIKHFFSHYKDLESGKFARVGDFDGIAAAEEEIMRSEAAYRSAADAKV